MAEQTNTETQVPSEAHGKASFPPFDSSTFAPQLVWLAICFTALYFILSRIALPRIGEVLEERRDRIQRDLDKAAELREETDKAIATYEEELATARHKANGIAEETRNKLNAEIAKESADVEAKISKKAEEAEARIVKAKQEAFTNVNEIALDTTAAIVKKLLGRKPTEREIREALK